MSEGAKTTIFVAVGLVVAVAAVASRPQFIEVRLEESVGQPLFADFDDPSQAARMTLFKYDPEMGELRSFEVARDEEAGAWTIPSHAGYPADAEARMRDAALMLVDLTVLGIASEVAGEHAMYGVLEPDRERLRLGDEGVGLQLTFEDRRGQRLASLVIGREVRDAESQRFVRIPGQDVVYAVEIEPDQLSTRFTDWIERDLLQLTSWDIQDVTIRNYSVDRGVDRVTLSRHFDFSAKYADNEWELVELTSYDGGPETIAELPEDQELNRDKLNDLRRAVDELQIVNVHRKPRGLTADLRAGSDFLQDRASQDDLRARGFWTHEAPGEAAELLAAHGEVHVGMQDGVQYVLRFGETVATSGDDESEGEHRYLFVTARMDEEKFPQPELAELPELPAGHAEEEDAAADEQQDEDASQADGGENPAANEDENGSDDSDENGSDDSDENAADDSDENASDDADENASDDAAVEEEEGVEAVADAEEEARTDREAEEARILQERERLNRENQRKLDEWNERLDNARQRVSELNVRFGDWYYVVAESQYNQIRLSLSDLVQDKEADDSAGDPMDDDFDFGFDLEGEGIEAFRQLQQGGLP